MGVYELPPKETERGVNPSLIVLNIFSDGAGSQFKQTFLIYTPGNKNIA